MGKIKKSCRKKKKQSNDVDRASHKQELETNTKLDVKKEEKTSETGRQLIPTAQSPFPPETKTGIETELVHTDENVACPKFAVPRVSPRRKCARYHSAKGEAPSTSHGSASAQTHKQLQKNLQEASACYKQNDAAAEEQIPTPLEEPCKASKSNLDFQKQPASTDGKKETPEQMCSRKELRVVLHRLEDCPKVLQDLKKEFGSKKAAKIMKQIKQVVKKDKKQSDDVDRASRKRKLENNEERDVKKQKTTLETGKQLIPTAQSAVPPETKTDIETKLVHTDEKVASPKFAVPRVSPRRKSARCHSAKGEAPSTSRGSASAQTDKQLQKNLQEASACYKQNDAAAAKQIPTPLEEPCKASESNLDFQKQPASTDGKKETPEQMCSRKELRVVLHRLEDCPKVLQDLKKEFGSKKAAKIMKQIKQVMKKDKNQSDDVDRASRKRKLENNEELDVKKQKTTLETGKQLIPTAPSPVPSKTKTDKDTELVHTDEKVASPKFAVPRVSPRRKSARCHSAKGEAPSTSRGSTSAQTDKQLQKNLQKAGACYKKKNDAAAAKQIPTPLEEPCKASKSNLDFQKQPASTDGKKETPEQMCSRKELRVVLHRLEDCPKVLQDLKKEFGSKKAAKMMKQIKQVVKKDKKQRDDVDRASRKRKLENNEELDVKKQKTTLETGKQLIPTAQSAVPPETKTDIETKLVHTDEKVASPKFAVPRVSPRRKSARCHSAKGDAPSTSHGSASAQTDKQLQKMLQEASACYKNDAAAEEQIPTPLEEPCKASESNLDFQKQPASTDGKKETPEQMCSRKELRPILLKLEDCLKLLQVFIRQCGDTAAPNITENIEQVENQNKDQSNDEDRESRKRKLQNNEKLEVKKEETTLEPAHQLIPAAPSHIPPEILTDIEMELVYIDEENIHFEFAQRYVSPSVQPICVSNTTILVSEKGDAPSTSHGRTLPRLDSRLQMMLQEAGACYRQRNYAAAMELFSTALEFCEQGCAIDVSCRSSADDVCSIASFIETKLVICYLKLGKPDDALNHSYRSIALNPAYFRNHLRLAALFRCLERYSEAARSCMIANHMYWMAGGTEQRTSDLIRLYWQAMIVEAITTEASFSVMYTPFVTEVTDQERDEINCVFARKHPDYTEYIYTDNQGNHILPETTNWPSQVPQKYLLTLGFKDKFIGKTMERWSRRKMPIFADREEPYMVVTTEETEIYWENTGKKILPVMDFIRSTRLYDDRCACSRGIEKLHYSCLLGRMQRVEEQHQVINQVMAELATVPYLQDVNEKDGEQLDSLMAVTMNALAGRNIEDSPVWDVIEKTGLLQDFIYRLADKYNKTGQN